MLANRVTVQLEEPVFSASQINTAEDCLRRWAFEYVWGLSSEGNASARLGKAVHTQLERWLAFATPPGGLHAEFGDRPARIAKVAIPPLPAPGTGDVEGGFTLRGMVRWKGFKDWTGIFQSHPTVIDHKTTSDLKWAKTAQELARDPQALLYALHTMLLFGSNYVELMWNYVTTGTRPKSSPVRTRLYLPQVIDSFGVVEERARELYVLQQQGVHPFSLRPTIASCEKYGGCPHRERCNLSSREKVLAMMQQDNARNQTLAERLAQVNAYGNGAGTANGQPAPTGVGPYMQQVAQAYPNQAPMAPTQPPQAAPQAAQQPWPQQAPQAAPQPAQQMAPAQAAQAPAPGQPVQGQDGHWYVPDGRGGWALYQAPQAAPQQAQQPQPQPQQQAPYTPAQAPNPPEQNSAAALAAAAAAQTAQTSTEETKRGRGRPAGSRNKGKKAEGVELSLEQRVFIAGMQAAIGSQLPNDPAQIEAALRGAGQLFVKVFAAEYGDE